MIAIPTNIAYRENVLGEFIPAEVQTLHFTFASREYYGADEVQNALNYKFHSDVIEWIIEQNTERNMPVIDGAKTLGVAPTLTQFVSDADANSARYQIQLQVTIRRDN